MAKRRQKTSQYTKNRNRIMAYQRRLRKKGMEIDIYFPTENELRKQGVKGTELSKYTRKLKTYTSKELKKLSKPVPQQAFIPQDNISTDSSFFDRVVISGFREHVSQFNPKASELLLSWLDKILSENDEHSVAIMLQDGAEHGNIVTYQIAYNTSLLYQYMSNMIDYLPDQGDLFKENLMQALELEEDYNELI